MASNRDVIERHVGTFTAHREAARRARQPVPGAELVPLGHCPVCGHRVPGITAGRRKGLCRVRINLHQHPTVPGWCIGSNSYTRPALEAEQAAWDRAGWGRLYAWSQAHTMRPQDLFPLPPLA